MDVGWIAAGAFAVLGGAGWVEALRIHRIGERTLAMQAKEHGRMVELHAATAKECVNLHAQVADRDEVIVALNQKLDIAQTMILQGELKLEEALKPRKRTPRQPVTTEGIE